MRKLYMPKRALLFCCALLPSLGSAQNNTKGISYLTQIEITKEKSLWFNTNNAAGLSLTPLNNFNEVSAKYIHNEGNFRLQQEGRREENICFNTNGALQLDGISLWGDFNFSNINTYDSRFNTMVINPLRDMPYYVADPVASRWKQQHYNLSVKAASPIFWNRIGFGCEADYTSQTGAKQNDPRANSYYYDIKIRPGFIVKLTDQHIIGVNASYENMFERSAPKNSNIQVDQPVFIMRGLGNYTPGMVGGDIGIFYYKSNKVGGAFQYGYHGDVELLLDAKYHYKVEDAYQAPTKPQRMGSTVQNFINGNVQLLFNGDFTNKVTLDYVSKNTDGIEFVQVLDNSFDVNRWITIAQHVRSKYKLTAASAKYDLFRNNDRGYSWKAGFNAEYTKTDDEYILPKSAFQAENFYAAVNATKNFNVGTLSSLLVGLNLGYNTNIDGMYEYNGADPTSAVVEELYKRDLEFLTSDYVRAGLDISYSIGLSKKSVAVFLRGSCQYLKPTEGSLDRVQAVGTVGLTF